MIMGNREVHGVCRGIDSSGALLLETDTGIEQYVGGEISVRAAD
ncbi:hypothetical protein JCM19236_5900 [Vibrio sp. JCM 19236]|nr:hypothetical protein JCM19236_5900 [Vibrio sp. JCM 19236]